MSIILFFADSWFSEKNTYDKFLILFIVFHRDKHTF
jgi:hypothetical protein